MIGISVVVPVHHGEAFIRETVASILAQRESRPLEVILVDDERSEGASQIVAALAGQQDVRVIAGLGRGAAAAINAGIRAARHPLVAQIDQDVVIQPGWMEQLIGELDNPSVAAAQGYYVCASDAGVFGRVMNLDLELRYGRIDRETDHVCTGNTIYRADVLKQVGLFDETLGYGYDNDISYRLRDAGYGLRINRSARAVHRWREGFGQYLTQQYGFGYGRIDLVAKHPHRVGGDAVSPTAMMLHPLLMLVALLSAAAGVATRAAGTHGERMWFGFAAAVLAGLVVERLIAGVAAFRRFGDAAALAFPLAHTARDLAWVAAIAAWVGRRLAGRPLRPSDSMTPRAAYPVNRADSSPAPKRPSA